MAVIESRHLHVFRPQFQENAVQLFIVVDVLFASLAFDSVKWGLGYVDVSRFDEFFHLQIALAQRLTTNGRLRGGRFGSFVMSILLRLP